MHSSIPAIAVFGDSLTEGYGLSSNHALPAALQTLLHNEGITIKAHNFGISGETSCDGLKRLDVVLAANPTAVILEFGANDCYIEEPVSLVKKNLSTMIAAFSAKNIPVLLVGIRAMAEIPAAYRTKFNPIFQQLSKQHNVLLYPDILAPYLGNPLLTLLDGLHPNEEGVMAIAQDMLPFAKKLVASLDADMG